MSVCASVEYTCTINKTIRPIHLYMYNETFSKSFYSHEYEYAYTSGLQKKPMSKTTSIDEPRFAITVCFFLSSLPFSWNREFGVTSHTKCKQQHSRNKFSKQFHLSYSKDQQQRITITLCIISFSCQLFFLEVFY